MLLLLRCVERRGRQGIWQARRVATGYRCPLRCTSVCPGCRRGVRTRARGCLLEGRRRSHHQCGPEAGGETLSVAVGLWGRDVADSAACADRCSRAQRRARGQPLYGDACQLVTTARSNISPDRKVSQLTNRCVVSVVEWNISAVQSECGRVSLSETLA
jgi:hypothetical protein